MIEVKLNGFQVRCINGYGHKENYLTEKKQKFWERLGVEIENSIQNEKGWMETSMLGQNYFQGTQMNAT